MIQGTRDRGVVVPPSDPWEQLSPFGRRSRPWRAVCLMRGRSVWPS